MCIRDRLANAMSIPLKVSPCVIYENWSVVNVLVINGLTIIGRIKLNKFNIDLKTAFFDIDLAIFFLLNILLNVFVINF